MFRYYRSVISGMIGNGKAGCGPMICEIDLTDRCTLDCSACWTHSSYIGKKPDLHELDFKVLRMLLNELKRIGTRTISLSGRGEPFLYGRFMDVVRFCRDAGMDIIINTNGLSVEESFIDEIDIYPVTLLKVSLWSLNEKTLQILCPALEFGQLEEILTKVGRIASKKPKILQLNFVITGQNINEIDNFINKSHELGVKKIKFEPVQPFNGNRFMLINESEKNKFDKNFDYHRKKLAGYGIKNNISDLRKKLNHDLNCEGLYGYRMADPCFFGWLGTRILASGKVVFCCECVDTYAGNINEKTFSEIWFSDGYSQLRRLAYRKNCVDLKKGRINCSYTAGTIPGKILSAFRRK